MIDLATERSVTALLRRGTAILEASGLETARAEAEWLLASLLGVDRPLLHLDPARRLATPTVSRYLGLLDRRAGREPLQYLLGWEDFHGLRLAVTPDVLVPRPETELAVELALQREFASLVDLGTGSGAIALALKRHRPQARIVAVDASAAALAVAQRNALRHGLAVEFRQGRWFEPLAGERFDVVLANPPYVAEGDPHLAALGFEPRLALTAGADGLDAIREIVREAPRHLAPGGWLLLEHGAGQNAKVRALLAGAGLEDLQSWPDLARIPRVAGGKVK